jgi:ATP-dependent RNA helicase DDX54/DBP10
VVILSPTRELAQQIHREANSLLKFAPNIQNVMCVGGDSLEQQFIDLQLSSTENRGPDIIVATPGRLLHLLIETTLANMFKRVDRLVVILDEADRLFEMGFKQEIEFIFQRLGTGTAQHGDGKKASHSGRQVLMFSATLPSMLLDFAKVGLNNPSFIRLDADAGLSPNLHVSFFTVRNEEKDAALLYLLREYIDTLWNKAFPDKQMIAQRGEHSSKKIIIFCASRHHVEYIMALLEAAGIHALGVYGKMDQAARRIGLAKFARGIVPILVVTDVAARGLDLPDIEVVVNYDFPPRPKLFIHRVGRTARLDSRTGQYSTGMALTLVGPDDWAHLVDTSLTLNLQLYNHAVEKNDANNRFAYYGNIPQLLVDMELERIHVLIDQSVDLVSGFVFY